MKINRFMIAAPKSGSGKTMITCALLQLLKDSGKNVLSYKCGPDYIDPMFHKKVLGVPSKNLDTFFTDEKTTVQLFLDERADGDFDGCNFDRDFWIFYDFEDRKKRS
jgi:cobyrinic acid a,c-diamide synthase